MEFGGWPAPITSLSPKAQALKQQGYSHEGIKLRPVSVSVRFTCYMTHTEAHILRTPVTDQVWRSPAVPGSAHTEGDMEIHRRGDISAGGWGARHRCCCRCLRYLWCQVTDNVTPISGPDIQNKTITLKKTLKCAVNTWYFVTLSSTWQTYVRYVSHNWVCRTPTLSLVFSNEKCILFWR